MKLNNADLSHCVACGKKIEYREPDTFFEYPEDEFLCNSCVVELSPEDLYLEDLDDVQADIESFINMGVTPPRYIE